jgi:hypothetical protein
LSYKIASFSPIAVVLKSRRRGILVLTYGEILTAERRRGARRGMRLDVRTSEKPIRVSCRRHRPALEEKLRARGVRVVDCWGCIITSSLSEFEEVLMNKPLPMRQS